MARYLQVSRKTIGQFDNFRLCSKPYKTWHRHLMMDALRKKRMNRTKKKLQGCAVPVTRSSFGQMRRFSLWSHTSSFKMTASWQPVLPEWSHQADYFSLPETCRSHFVGCSGIIWLELCVGFHREWSQGQRAGVHDNAGRTWAAWVSESFQNRYIFTLNGAPSKTSTVKQQCCKTHGTDIQDRDTWQPSSSNLNPIDLAISSILKSDLCSASHGRMPVSKRILEMAWSDLMNSTLRHSWLSAMRDLKYVVNPKGAHIEP